jgi:hypothetical protein
MKSARVASVVTWVYAAGFGIPAIPVAVYLVDRGGLPSFMGLFDMYGGPWYLRFQQNTFVVLLVAFLVVTMVAAWTAWLIWKGSKVGAVLSLALLPVEAVFWIGFALPLPWLSGIARAALIGLAWKSLKGNRRRSQPGGSQGAERVEQRVAGDGGSSAIN